MRVFFVYGILSIVILFLVKCSLSIPETNNQKNTELSYKDSVLLDSLATSYHDSALICYDEQKWNKALFFLKQCELPVLEKIGNTDKIGSCYGTMGYIFREYDVDSAKWYFEKAYKYNKKDASFPFEIGNYHSGKGDYESAISFSNQGLAIAIDQKDTLTEILCLNNISNIYFVKLNYQKALEISQTGLALNYSEERNKVFLLNSGNALLKLKQLDEAQAVLESSLPNLNSEIEDSVTVSRTLTNIGIIAKKQKKYTKALSYMLRGRKFISYPEDLAANNNNIADVLLLQNKPDSALHYYQKAISTILPSFQALDWKKNPSSSLFKDAILKTDLMGYLRDKANALQTIGFGNKDKKMLEAAVQTYSLADSLCDDIRLNTSKDASRLFWREEANPMYVHGIKLCFLQNMPEKAYLFFEKSRAVMLLDALNERNQKKTAQTGINQTQLLDLKTLQQKLPADRAIVEYIMPDTLDDEIKTDSSFALVITQDKVFIKRLFCPQQELYNLVESQQKTTENPDESHLWYQRLIEPLDLPDNVRHLTISVNGLLNGLAFEGLRFRKSDGIDGYLLNKYAISYAYSASLLYFDIRHDFEPHNKLLGFAPVRFGDFGLSPLPETEKSLNALSQTVDSKLFVHKDACKARFLENASNYRYLQLFTHATAYDSTAKEPVIYFADERLPLSELYDSRLNADLVVLTACETGKGIEQKGEGANSLARGFAYAGVPSTLATLWSVPEDAASQITVSFYAYLDKGVNKDDALQLAKIDYLKSQEGRQGKIQPYYWAAFSLIGAPENTLQEPNTSLWYWIVGVVVVGLLVLGVLRFLTPSRFWKP